MKHLTCAIATVCGVSLCSAALYSEPASGHQDAADIDLFPLDKIKWQDGPPSLPKGAMIAVLEGDPTKEGPFVFRIKIPDGYRVPPHTHPKTERVTVISGTFNIGMGDRFDETETRPMPAGTYGYWQAGMKHFVWAKGETILQFHGAGPWSIQYVNPDDDPRRKRGNAGLKSGPQAGDNLPGPFFSLVANAEEPRMVGTKIDFFECFGSDPTILVFARAMSEPLTRLATKLDMEMTRRKPAKLRALVVMLSDEDALEGNLKDFAAHAAIKYVNLALTEPPGPKPYQLSREADVTVLLCKKRKVITNHAFRKGELDEKAIGGILSELPKILSPEKVGPK